MKEIAKILLDINAVTIDNKNKFTWASGIKSPIYTDNRLITAYPKERKILEKEFASQIIKHFPEVEIIVGTATAGISHAAYISNILELPMGYVRGSKKDHGRKNQIEGIDVKGRKVVVIEDLLSTGNSALQSLKVLQESGAIVLGIGAIFKYGISKLKNNFKNINYFSLTNLDELLEVAVEKNIIHNQETALIREFIDSL